MSTRTYAPRDTTYQAPKWATQKQIDFMKKLLTENKLYDGHYDRLWKLLEVHEVDVQIPGDGTRMSRQTASATIEWLLQQVKSAQRRQQNRPEDVGRRDEYA